VPGGLGDAPTKQEPVEKLERQPLDSPSSGLVRPRPAVNTHWITWS
jgi:hypothetical protein